MFRNKVCVITGGVNGIGKAIYNEFTKENCKCYVIDITEGNHFVGDISNKDTLQEFFEYVIKKEEKIDFLILDTIHNLPGEIFDFLAVFPYLKNAFLTTITL